MSGMDAAEELARNALQPPKKRGRPRKAVTGMAPGHAREEQKRVNADALATALRSEAIDYLPLSALGGLRHAHEDSPNAGWRNPSFRGYPTRPWTASPEWQTTGPLVGSTLALWSSTLDAARARISSSPRR